MTAPIKFKAFCFLLALLVFPVLSFAASADLEKSIKVEGVWSRELPPGSTTAAIFMTIKNSGVEPDRLIQVIVPEADKAEIHDMKTVDGIMQMRPLDKGLDIPAKGEVKLASGGIHVMAFNQKDKHKPGDVMPVILTFERVGTIETVAKIESIRYREKAK